MSNGEITYVIDGIETLPMRFLRGRAVGDIPKFGQGTVRPEVGEIRYSPPAFGADEATIDACSVDSAMAQKAIHRWHGHVNDFTYYVQFLNDPSHQLISALHEHTELVSILYDSRLNMDSGPLWLVFDAAQRFAGVHSEYRGDPDRASKREKYIESLDHAHTPLMDRLAVASRLIERAVKLIELGSAAWSEMPPIIARPGGAVQMQRASDVASNRQDKIPVEIQVSIEKFRSDHPDPERTAFLMMQFGATKAHSEIVDSLRESFAVHEINLLRADDKEYHDDLFLNILTYIYGSGFGIAIFERLETNLFNPNVSLEVGYMLALAKPVCLVKDQTLSTLHTDLIGKLYRPFDPQNVRESIKRPVLDWARDKGIISDGESQ